MGAGASMISGNAPENGPYWQTYARLKWRSLRVRQLDEFMGLQRPAIKRGDSQQCLADIVKRIQAEPLPLMGDQDDGTDLATAIQKLNSGSILHTEKRALERLLAQRYEEALAAAAAANKEGEEAVLGGASEVLQQVLTVYQQNDLPTELDKPPFVPAPWRLRTHRARRLAFLVVRALVRLKREVKRLGDPLPGLDWLVPVAAAERWGQVKALAAEHRRLEGVLGDTELAITQLKSLKEAQSQVGPPKTATGRSSATPRALRSSGGRASSSGGRALSESGMGTGRRPRTSLTAEPSPLPALSSTGGRAGPVRRAPGTPGTPGTPGGMGSNAGSPLRPSINHRRSIADPSCLPGPLVPTLSPARSPAGPGGLPSPFGGQRRQSFSGSANGGAPASPGLCATPGSRGGILSGPGTPLLQGHAQSPAAPAGAKASSLPEVVPPAVGGGGSAGGAATSPSGPQPLGRVGTLMRSTFVVRNTFAEGGTAAAAASAVAAAGPGPGAPAAGSTPTLPALAPLRPPSGASSPQLHVDVSSSPLGFAHAKEVRDASNPSISDVLELLQAPAGDSNPMPVFGSTAAANGRPKVAPDTALSSTRGHTRTWGVNVDSHPSPPAGAPGARRPLGPLSHAAGPTGNTPAAQAAAAVLAAASGALVPISIPDTLPPGVAPAPVDKAPAQPMQLIQDGESIDQALARFQVAADDARNALVDVSRKFRATLDVCNSAWPDQRWWLSASTVEDAALDTWPASEEYVVHRADAVRSLKAGGVALQFVCFTDEPLTGPTGNQYDLWTSDPWEVAADLLPSLVASPAATANGGAAAGAGANSRLIGMPLGVRVLQQLANAVAEVAGPQALDSLPIILHISERQQEALVADLLQYSIYRRLRRNLYIVVQAAVPPMRFNADLRVFEPAGPDQPAHSAGTGYAMLQLLWPGAAMVVNDQGDMERLPHSLMHELRARKTEWFLSRSVSDLSLLLDDGALDMRTLAHVAYMWTQPHLHYSMAIECASTYAKHREMIAQHGSVLLCRKPKTTGMVMGRLDGAVRVDRFAQLATKPQLPVVELLACELNSEHMQREINEIASARGTTTSVGLGRYIFRFEVLEKMLTGPTVLRPKLLPVVEAKALQLAAKRRASGSDPGGPPGASSSGALQTFSSLALTEHQIAHAASQGLDTVMVRLQLSMTDLSNHHMIRVVSVRAHRQPVHLRGQQDAAALVQLLIRSDADLSSAEQRLAAKLPSFSRHNKPGQSILLFVQDNGVSLTATNVAAGLVRRERGDHVHLVTVVATEAQRPEGAALLDRFLKAFRGAGDVTAHVLAQDSRGLLECVADVIHTHRCGLVIIGSASLTSLPANGVRAPGGPPGTPSKAPGTPGGAGGAGGRGGPGVVQAGPADDPMADMMSNSVALSVLRTFQLPTLVITANTRHYYRKHGDTVPGVTNGRNGGTLRGPGGAGAPRLHAMVVVERHARPMMHHLARFLLEPTLRQDILTLTQVLPPQMQPGAKDHDVNSVQAVALKTLMANYEAISAGNDFHNPNKALVYCEWDKALCSAARDGSGHLLCLQLPPSTTHSLPGQLLTLLRACTCPVLVYPEKLVVPGSGLMVGDE